jgi:hyaluronan synthase
VATGPVLYARRQQEGIAKLLSIARETDHRERARGRARSLGRVGRSDGGIRAGHEALVSAGQVTPGALRERYDIPEVRFRRWDGWGLVLSSALGSALVAWRLGWQDLALAGCAAPAFAFRFTGWVLSWFDKPFTVPAPSARYLDRLRVTVAVPVYNEDPGLLDRCLYALVNQSRPPQLIWVVDDGSREDYSALRRYWERWWPCGTEVRWTRQHNQGKRRAHAVVFANDPDADIFVTVDSDTTLALDALEEGLKPFRRRSIMSVAGIELGFNASKNLLTRLQCSLQVYAQAVIGAAWSVAGDMYTNRGPFALYRARMIWEILPVYRDETFFGRRVILGDDSLLALCGSHYGRSVQQLSAFGLTMWPETLSHHLRQRLRWARGRAVRNFWRVRYRPFLSYCWWFTVTGIYGFLMSCGTLVILALWWPATEADTGRLMLALLALSIPNSLRTLCFRRSDETLGDRILLILIRPLAALWSSVMLARVIRLWGTVTLLRQGWTTRQAGAELVLEPVMPGKPVATGEAA